MRRIYMSRWLVTFGSILLFGGILLLERSYLHITLGMDKAPMHLALLFTAVSYVLAWVFSLLWKSNRDTMIHEMGDLELQLYKSAIEQQIADRGMRSQYRIEDASESKPK